MSVGRGEAIRVSAAYERARAEGLGLVEAMGVALELRDVVEFRESSALEMCGIVRGIVDEAGAAGVPFLDDAVSYALRLARDASLVVDEIAVIRTDIVGCARCGEGHQGLGFRALTHPVEAELSGASTPLTHWASCPTNGEPILLRVTQRESLR